MLFGLGFVEGHFFSICLAQILFVEGLFNAIIELWVELGLVPLQEVDHSTKLACEQTTKSRNYQDIKQ